jgi:WD40 repeat protein
MKTFILFISLFFILPPISSKGNEIHSRKWTTLSDIPPQAAEKIFHHDWPVLDLAFSFDGKLLATLSDNNYRLLHPEGLEHRTIFIRDILGKRIKTIPVPDNTLTIAFSTNNKLIASISSSNPPRIWEVETGKILGEMQGSAHSSDVEVLFFSADNDYIFAMYSDGKIKKWGLKTLREIPKISSGNSANFSATLSHDKKWMAIASGENSIEIQDIESKDVIATLQGHPGRVSSLALSPNGKHLAIGYMDNPTAIWDIKNNKLKNTIDIHDSACSISFSPTGKIILITSCAGRIETWDLELKKRIININSCQSISKAIFSPDGKYIATASDSDVSIWTNSGLSNIIQPRDRLFDFYAIAFSPNDMHIATIDRHGLKMWNIDSKKILFEIKKDFSCKSFLVFSPTGRYLAMGSAQTAWVVDTASGLVIEHVEKVNSLVFSPDGNRIAVKKSDKNEILILNFLSKKNIAQIRSEYRLNHFMAFSPDGKRVATGNHTNLAEIWTVENGKYVADLWPLPKEARAFRQNLLSFSRNGHFQARGADGDVQIWDTISRRKILSFESNHRQIGTSFSPDGKRIALIDKYKGIEVWDINSKKPLSIFKKTTGNVKAVDFSNNGKRLAVLYENNQIEIHDVESRKDPIFLHKSYPELIEGSMSPDGKILALLYEDGSAAVWQIGRTNPVATKNTYVSDVSDDISFFLDSQSITMADSENSTMKNWYFLEGKILKNKILSQTINCIPISSHQLLCQPRENDKNMLHWLYFEARSGITRMIKSEHLPPFYYPIIAKLSQDGKTIAVGTEEATIILISLDSYKIIKTLRHPASYVGENPARIFALDFSSDGDKLATGSENGDTIIWNLKSGAQVAYFHGQSGSATAVVFSPDNKKLATGSFGHPIIIWDIQSKEKIAKLSMEIFGCVRDIAFADDGKKIAFFSTVNRTPSFGIFHLERLELESNTFVFSAGRFATFLPEKRMLTGFFEKNDFLGIK